MKHLKIYTSQNLNASHLETASNIIETLVLTSIICKPFSNIIFELLNVRIVCKPLYIIANKPKIGDLVVPSNLLNTREEDKNILAI